MREKKVQYKTDAGKLCLNKFVFKLFIMKKNIKICNQKNIWKIKYIIKKITNQCKNKFNNHSLACIKFLFYPIYDSIKMLIYNDSKWSTCIPYDRSSCKWTPKQKKKTIQYLFFFFIDIAYMQIYSSESL